MALGNDVQTAGGEHRELVAAHCSSAFKWQDEAEKKYT